MTSVTVSFPAGQCSRLVENDGCDIPCSFEDVQALDQNAEVGSAPCTDHDRGGSRKPEGTGTSDDQDRHRRRRIRWKRPPIRATVRAATYP